MEKEYDLVVFGATGFTGKYVCKELLKKVQTAKIAFAGRTRKKLEAILDWVRQDHSVSCDDNVGFIVADVNDDASLINMCKQSKIVLDCVGPFKLWGEAVVKACLDAGSDYIDITGEPEYIGRIQRKYGKIATFKGVYILPSCGFDCVPSDLGMVFAKKRFKGTLTAVENYFALRYGEKGLRMNYGTYASLVNSVSDAISSGGVKLSSSPHDGPLPVCGPKLKMKGFHRNQGMYAIPFVGTDVPVVRASQRYYYENFQDIPVQFAMYSSVSIVQTLALAIFFFVLGVFTRFTLGVKLLLKYPAFFSGGIFNKNGPTEEQMADCGFQFTMHCEGYKDEVIVAEVLEGKGPKHSPDSQMTVTISGPELAYVSTPITMVQAAICLMKERAQLPATGGVYLPGPAFKDTTLIERLQKNGISFERTYKC